MLSKRVQFTIDGRTVAAWPGATILDAARQADIYIPALCHHPDLLAARETLAVDGVFQGGRRLENAAPGRKASGCGLCIVSVAGELQPVAACTTPPVAPDMVVTTNNDAIQKVRRERLIPILARHRPAGLTSSQQEGFNSCQCSSIIMDWSAAYPHTRLYGGHKCNPGRAFGFGSDRIR